MDRPDCPVVVVGDARYSFIAGTSPVASTSSQRFFRKATVRREKLESPRMSQQGIVGDLSALPRVNSIYVHKPSVPAQRESVTLPIIHRKPG